MVKEIITDAEKLSIRSDEIEILKENKLMRDTICDIKDTMREYKLSSLSAIQVGTSTRIFVIKFGADLKTFINPIITNAKGITINKETCSSIPGKTFIRPRNNDINVTYMTPLGKVESAHLVGQAAYVFQHCVDHLDGLLLTDIGLEIDADFENASEEERAEVIRAYMDCLDMKEKEIKEEIDQDEELHKIDRAIDFMTAVQKGEVTLIPDNTPREEKEKEVTNEKE